jgi:hypothetical protein
MNAADYMVFNVETDKSEFSDLCRIGYWHGSMEAGSWLKLDFGATFQAWVCE